MSTAIATIATDAVKKIHDITQESHERYARKIGARYYVVKSTRHVPPHFAKFDILRELSEMHEHVLYLDADIYVKRSSPNIFEQYPESAAFNEPPHPRPDWLKDSLDWIKANLDPNWPDGRYFNTGVLVFDSPSIKRFAELLKDFEPKPGVFYEQEQLNVLLYQAGCPKTALPQCWNQFCSPEWLTEDKAKKAHFLHATGCTVSKKYEILSQLSKDYP